MDGKKSKFDFDSFHGGYHHFAVNAAKYSEAEAIKIYQEGWWFDYSPTDKRSVEVWAFRLTPKNSH